MIKIYGASSRADDEIPIGKGLENLIDGETRDGREEGERSGHKLLICYA